MTKRTNKWTFANLSENISKQVWQITESYKARFRDPEQKPRHLNGFPIQLCKYVDYTYLTGGRLMDGIVHTPQINIVNKEGKVYVAISKVNQKHKALDGTGREVIDLALPVFNEYEQAMWNFITDGGLTTDANEIFQFDRWKSTSKHNLNCLIKTNFRTDLRDEAGHVHRDHGITPHIFRHMRAFNVIVNYGVDVPLAIKWFGWTDQRMLYYYAHIRKALNISNQVEMLKRGNLLTNLAIDMGKAITTY